MHGDSLFELDEGAEGVDTVDVASIPDPENTAVRIVTVAVRKCMIKFEW